MIHHPVEDLLGVYALNALDDDERRQVESHLAECPRCRAEVDAHREVASRLGQSGARAPDGVWERIAEHIEAAPPPPLRLVVDDGSRHPSSARRWRSLGGVITAAAAAVAIVALSVSSIRQQDTIDRVEQAQGLSTAATQAFADPDARIAELAADDGSVLVRAAVLPDGTGYLLADALPDLDESIYQLWGGTGDEVVSLGTIGATPGVLSFAVDATVTLLMITEEEKPVPSSSNEPVVLGTLV